MIKLITRKAAHIGACLATLVTFGAVLLVPSSALADGGVVAPTGLVQASPLTSGSVVAYQPYSCGSGCMVIGGGVRASGNFETEVCAQVRQANGTFITISGDCYAAYYGGWQELAFDSSDVKGHTYRTWAWASGFTAAVSGSFTA